MERSVHVPLETTKPPLALPTETEPEKERLEFVMRPAWLLLPTTTPEPMLAEAAFAVRSNLPCVTLSEPDKLSGLVTVRVLLPCTPVLFSTKLISLFPFKFIVVLLWALFVQMRVLTKGNKRPVPAREIVKLPEFVTLLLVTSA